MKKKLEFMLGKMHPVEIYLMSLIVAFLIILAIITVSYSVILLNNK